MKLRTIFASGLLLGLFVPQAAAPTQDPRPLPKPLPTHPGNVFLTGEHVVIALPPTAGDAKTWRLIDYEGKTVSQGSVTNSKAAVGNLPRGYYELQPLKDGVPNKVGVTIGVLAPLRAPTPRTSPIGVDASMAWNFLPRQQESAASLCALAGVNWVRDRLSWSEMEPEKGRFASANKYDDTARAQSEAGLRVLQVHHDLPPWAGKNAKRQPADLRDAYWFMQEMARRWRGQVLAFEPWNEADTPVFGGHTGTEIAAFQKASYLGLKAGNSNVIVCQNVFASPQPNVLADFNANCAWPYFDTFNLHHYCPLAEYPAVYAAFRAISAGKPMWVSEFNLPVLWTGNAAEQEPSAQDLHVQAERVAQLFASCLQEGPVAAFYFLLPHYCEGQTQFGLLHKDLTPRPAYLALAAVGRLLADATPLGRLRLDGDTRAFAFRSRPDGEERDVIVAWSSAGDRVLKLREKPLALFDHLGRSLPNLSANLNLSSAPIFAICAKDSLPAVSLQLPPTKPELKSDRPSSIVLQVLISQDKIVPSLSAYRCSSTHPETFSIFAYNFGSVAATGQLTATVPEGWTVDLPRQIELAPGERKEFTLALDCRAGMTTPADTVRISGNFGSAGEAILSLRLSPEPFTVVSGRAVKIPGAAEPQRWQPIGAGGSEFKITSSDADTITFTARFGAGDRWVYPVLALRDQERPPKDCVALVAVLTAAEGQANFRAILETESGSAYFADFYPQPKPGETIEAVALLATAMFGEGWSKPDENGKLDPGKIRSIRIGCNAQSENVAFTLKNVRWVTGSNPVRPRPPAAGASITTP